MEVHEAWERIRNKSSEWWDQLQKKFSPYIDKLDEWTTPPTLSLRIEDEKITLLHLEKRGESIRVISLKAIPKESDLIDISEFPESAICVSGISAARCLVRTLELRGIKANEIEDAFRFQAETLIPYPPEEALFGKILLHSEGDHHELAMIAAKAADVEESSEGFILKGITPQYITSDVVAFACFVKTIIPSDSTIAFYLSRDNSFGIALNDGKL
ncbi:MAG: hypothetical protein KDK40_04885, partial [Chlamydiia bacterium]|nr:hypothetical protein [Chlamydiia bacterium]